MRRVLDREGRVLTKQIIRNDFSLPRFLLLQHPLCLISSSLHNLHFDLNPSWLLLLFAVISVDARLLVLA